MNLFKALAEPTRQQILELLASNGELSASSIYQEFGLSNPAISQHLKILREVELVDVLVQSQKRIYRINFAKISEVEQWVKNLVEKPAISSPHIDRRVFEV